MALCAIAIAAAAPAQTAAYRWIRQIGGSGHETLAGVATDRQGNTYVAGSTTSIDFPVVSASQPHPGGSGLFRVDGPGANYRNLYQSGIAGATAVLTDPRNPRVVYAATGDTILRSTDAGDTWQTLSKPSASIVNLVAGGDALYIAAVRDGILKSVDGGATFTPINHGLPIAAFGQPYSSRVWVSPHHPNVLLAQIGIPGGYAIARSVDGGASWDVPVGLAPGFWAVSFDPSTPGRVFATTFNYATVSLDDGLTWAALGNAVPSDWQATSIVADPARAGVLYASSSNGLWRSTDNGATWTRKLTQPAGYIAADASTGVVYASQPAGAVMSTDGFDTSAPVGPRGISPTSLAAGAGHLYIGAPVTSDVFIAKLDADGNTIWATYLGGSTDDVARAMTIDAAGAVYVTGATRSQDFPATSGAYAKSGVSFVTKLNADGSLAWATYFAGQPNSIAVDSAGHAYIAGVTLNAVPTTPGAYQTRFDGILCGIGCLISIPPSNGFVTEFDAAGASLVFSTMLGKQTEAVSSVALLPDGSVVAAGQRSFYKLDATGSSLLLTKSVPAYVESLALDGSGNLLVTGSNTSGPPFPSTPGAVQPLPYPPTAGSTPGDAYLMRMDSQLNVIAATLLGGEGQDISVSAAAAPDGSVVVGGSTYSKAFPTVGELQSDFSGQTGFLSRLNGDFSSLFFSSFVGDSRRFYVQSVTAAPDGGMIFGGSTRTPPLLAPIFFGANGFDLFPQPTDSAFVVRLDPVRPAGPRIDSVISAASRLAAPLSQREAIQVRGSGFADDAVLLLNGNPVPLIARDASTLTAEVPLDFQESAATLQVISGGQTASVAVPCANAAPAIFSRDGSGVGQGYILNKDGSVNSRENPAHEGDPITIFVTGMGPMSFDHGYAVTETPITVAVDGFYANGISAVLGPVDSLPGDVYQVSVYVPRPSDFANDNPNLKGFIMPPQSPVNISVAGTVSQQGIFVSVTH